MKFLQKLEKGPRNNSTNFQLKRRRNEAPTLTGPSGDMHTGPSGAQKQADLPPKNKYENQVKTPPKNLKFLWELYDSQDKRSTKFQVIWSTFDH